MFPDQRDENGEYITDYAAFCFDEAAALAGLHATNRANKEAYDAARAETEAAEAETVKVLPRKKGSRGSKNDTVLGDAPPPKGVAEIRETPSGPIIVGTVPVIKRTKPYVKRMTVAEKLEADRKAAEAPGVEGSET